MEFGRDGWFAAAAWPAILAAVVFSACRDRERPSTDSSPSAVSRANSAQPRTTAGSARGAPPPPPAPTRYDPTRTASSITPSVARRLRAIAAIRPRRADVFMKVGASGTASGHFLGCFAPRDDPRHELDLGGRHELMATIEFFRGGDAEGRTPFDRTTRAAVSGKAAGWVIAGSPPPLEVERAAIDPRFAFVGFGTNDVHYGPSPRAALPRFYAALAQVLERLEAGGTVPIVTGLPPRDHDLTAERWVPTYDVVTRGLAEQRQLPYLSLYQATKDLPDRGLVRDGVHGNAYREGHVFRPCVFSPAGLEYHYNVRNLASIQLLDVVKRVVVDGSAAPDAPRAGWPGRGTTAAPFEVDRLPYTHSPADIGHAPVVYRFELRERTGLRIIALGRDATGPDVALFATSPGAGQAVARGKHVIEGALEAGTYWITVADSTASPAPGRMVAVIRCDRDDPACSQSVLH